MATTPTYLFRITAGKQLAMFDRQAMATNQLLEAHLEGWICANPQVLGGNVKIVATQFDRWSTLGGDSAAERLDILGLDASGQLVVVEVKRAGDRKVHLQAITYAALVAGFTKEKLADAHASWINRTRSLENMMTIAEALDSLTVHVDEAWDEDLLTRPRITLVAEEYPSQVLTTVNWLTGLAPADFNIECHQVSIFKDPDRSDLLCIAFRRVYPVDSIDDRLLSPSAAQVGSSVSKEIAERSRRANSVQVIIDAQLIPDGSSIELRLDTYVKSDVVSRVNVWFDQHPELRNAKWAPLPQQPHKSLLWGSKHWSASGLAKEIVGVATESQVRSLAGPEVWFYGDESLFEIAERHRIASDM